MKGCIRAAGLAVLAGWLGGVGGVGGVGNAAVLDDPAGSGVATATGGAARARTSQTTAGTAAADISDLFNRLAGEWDGTIQSRGRDGAMSASLASASARLSDDGKRFEMYYEGYAFGRPTEGALVVSAEPTGAVSMSFSREGTTVDGAGKASSDALTFAYTRSVAGRPVSFEQVVRLADSNRLVLEVFALDKQGDRKLTLRLDFSRLPTGHRAAASASFSTSRTLASARSARDNASRQASAADQ